jgi:hypothetical protein
MAVVVDDDCDVEDDVSFEVAGTIVLLECNGLSLTESDPSNRDDPEAV